MANNIHEDLSPEHPELESVGPLSSWRLERELASSIRIFDLTPKKSGAGHRVGVDSLPAGESPKGVVESLERALQCGLTLVVSD